MVAHRLHVPISTRFESCEALERGRYICVTLIANRRTSRRRDDHRAARALSARRKVCARYAVPTLRTASPHSSRSDLTLASSCARAPSAGMRQFKMLAELNARRQRLSALRRCGDGWRAPSSPRCDGKSSSWRCAATSTCCRRGRVARGAMWSNFEWTVCEVARASMDGRRRDSCVLAELRAWVCGACRASAAVWNAVAREMP